MNGNAIASTKVPPLRVLSNALRRRVWRLLFAPGQSRLGTFFIDPRDHIGKERLVTADSYEAPTLQTIDWLAGYLKLNEGMAIDGGANIGNHACRFAACFEHVLCVEPGRVAGLVLEANLVASGRRNWEIAHCALGDRPGTGSLQIVDDVNLGSSQVIASADATGDFPIQTGDRIVAACRRPDLPVSLVKLDVEGAEAVALAGLARTLARHQPLLCVEALAEEKWHAIRDVIMPLGYVTFLTLTRTRSGVSGIDFLTRQWRLAALRDPFPAGGHDMIFCLAPPHARALGLS